MPLRRSVLCFVLPVVAACAAGETPEGLGGGGQSEGAGGATSTQNGGSDEGGNGGKGEFTGGGGNGECGNEVCGDQIDNDCDELIDEDCPCDVGATEACYSGPDGTADVGNCFTGERLCLPAGEFGEWGSCYGEILPADELCDIAMQDENCDGALNEGCECADGSDPVACGTDVGACIAGTQTCTDGVLGLCIGQAGPFTETCNNVDDDCDGVVDDGLTQTCGGGQGACAAGVSTCTDGAWGACLGGTNPVPETCNNVDDDCDGNTDEDLVQSCGTDVGLCSAGTQICQAGAWGVCTGGQGPVGESCNGTDDDCDGTTDEGCNCTNGQMMSCGTDVGACVAGSQTCNSGNWSMCTGSVGPLGETCNNVDDDCDGATDENLSQSCGTDVGACEFGTQACSAGNWGTCTGGQGPVTETCNNIDDDCDGLKDESLTQQCGQTDVGVCAYGTSTCSMGNWTSCSGAVNPVTEICGNGLDDDCDGTADEAVQCPMSGPVCTCPATTFTADPLDTITLTASCSDPDGGAVSYQWTVTQRPTGSTAQPASPNAASTTFFVDLAGSYTIVLTTTDNEGQTTTCTSTITAVPPQDLHVELIWDTAWGDADLHLIRAGANPATSWYSGSDDCWFANDPAAWPPNGGAGNASLDIDDTDGFGPENINIDNSPQTGTYEVGAAYYCQRSLQSNPNQPINPGSGPATGTVKVYCGGVLVSTIGDINFDRTGRFVDVASVTWPGCAVTVKNTPLWTAQVQQTQTTNTLPIHCRIQCNNNSDCTPGEACINTTEGKLCLMD